MAPKFTTLIGNPPYQMLAGGKRHQVYSAFYEELKNIAEHTTMIFPSGWQWSLGSASGSVDHPAMRDDQHIISVDNYAEDEESPVQVFDTVGTGGVSIVHRNADYRNDGLVEYSEYGIPQGSRDLTVVRYWGQRTQKIFDRLAVWRVTHDVRTMDHHVAPMLSFGLQSFDARNPKYASSTPVDGWIPCWGKGQEAGYGWHWIDPAFPKLVTNKPDREIHRWKVVFGVAAGMSTLHRKAFILQPGEVFTGAFTAMFCDTQSHAENLLSYMQTDFYKFLGSETAASINTTPVNHRFVPDVSTVTNPRTGKIGWESDWTDDDLRVLLQDTLHDDDWQYMIATAAVANSSKKQRY